MCIKDRPDLRRATSLDIAQAGSSDCHPIASSGRSTLIRLRVGSGPCRGKQLGRLERAVLLGAGRSQAGMGLSTKCKARSSPGGGLQRSATDGTPGRPASRLREVGLASTLRRSTTYETDVYLKYRLRNRKLQQPTHGHPDPLRSDWLKAHWSRRTLLGEGIAISYRDVLKTQPTTALGLST